MAASTSPVLPGRLGTPAMTLRDDPRADPRMIAAMVPFGLDAPPEPAPVERRLADRGAARVRRRGRGGLRGPVRRRRRRACPRSPASSGRVEVIRGLDGNDVTLYVHRPAGVDGPLPGVLHLHGGGMVLLEAAGAAYGRWRDELAATGLVVVGVEFRNGGGKHGPYPVPGRAERLRRRRCAGWSTSEPQLGISTLIVSGESGGGNLTLATVLRAKRDGMLDHIDGVYAHVPVHLQRLGRARARADVAVRERRLLPRGRHDGRAGQGLRPDRRARHRPAGLAAARRRPTTSPACRRT